ncbi:FAD-dependent oxidoreductase [Halosimplex halophilum]|uniref:FAD-dependent oxidoreductase n=1 Tax=Halosimplex halophilum TaxID=2559572 RepID=UPI00107F5662|nr:FAD-dependent oxidoreductase [Halosimplex halophilum]
MGADEPEFDRGVSLWEQAREYLEWYPTADVDVLVVGGGVQGLVLLDELVDRGYAAALVSNTPLGGGQTFDWPGALAKGYLNPDRARREAVDERWLPFAEDARVPVEGGEWYVCSTDHPYRHLVDQWDEAGYEYEERELADLHDVYREGTVFAKGSGEHVAAIDEYVIDREALVEALAADHEERVVVGDITAAEFATGEASAPALERLTVETHQELTLQVEPDYVVAATGTGTHRFVDSLVGGESFRDAGGDADAVRGSIDPVTCRNQLVLAVRGPAEDLPAVGAYLPHKGMSVVPRRHRHREANYVTWYVTNDSAAEDVDPEDTTDEAMGTLDPEKVEVGYNKLFDLVPAVKDRAADGADLEFYAYATLQQRIDGDAVPHAEPLAGVENVGVALPSCAAGVWQATDDALDFVADAVDPSGPVDGVPTGGDPPYGQLADDRPGARWLDWKALGVRYPRVQNRPDAVEK